MNALLFTEVKKDKAGLQHSIFLKLKLIKSQPMTKTALIIKENRTIQVRRSILSHLIWVDIFSGESYYFNDLKFL